MADEALDLAWDQLYREPPNPDRDQKLEVVAFAPAIAGFNRGIVDKKRINKAFEFVYERTVADLQRKDGGKNRIFDIIFVWLS